MYNVCTFKLLQYTVHGLAKERPWVEHLRSLPKWVFCSLVPRPRPAFRCSIAVRFSVLRAMESWAGPGNETTVGLSSVSHLTTKMCKPSCPCHVYSDSMPLKQIIEHTTEPPAGSKSSTDGTHHSEWCHILP